MFEMLFFTIQSPENTWKKMKSLKVLEKSLNFKLQSVRICLANTIFILQLLVCIICYAVQTVIFTSPLGVVQNIVMSMSVCLSVCLSTGISKKLHF